MENEFHGNIFVTAGIAAAVTAGSLISILSGYLLGGNTIGFIIYALIYGGTVVFLSLITNLFIENRQKQDTQEKEGIEWEATLQIAKKADNRITDKISEFVLKEAKSSLTEEKQQQISIIVKTKREEILAEHIIDVFNELFEEEKESES